MFLVYWKDGEFDSYHQPAAGNFSHSRYRDNTAASDCRSWIPGKKKKNLEFLMSCTFNDDINEKALRTTLSCFHRVDRVARKTAGETGVSASGVRNSHKATSCVATY